MKILKMWEYHKRIIYLVQIENKYQLFYKSIGETREESAGKILPHLLLKEEEEFSPDGLGYLKIVGWIPKAFMFRGKFEKYRLKVLSEFPSNMHFYMEEVKKITISKDIDSVLDPSVINEFCAKYIKSKTDYVDWWLLGRKK